MCVMNWHVKELLIFITSPEKNEHFSYKIEDFRIDGLFKFTEQYLVTAEYIFLLIEWGMNSYWERIPLIIMFFLLNVVTSINHFISSHRYFTLYLPLPTTLFLPSTAIFPSMYHSRFLYCFPSLLFSHPHSHLCYPYFPVSLLSGVSVCTDMAP